MSNSPLPSYKSPPLHEVVFGVTFSPLERFKAVHLGELWKRFPEFPEVDDAPLLRKFVVGELELRDPPFARTWFIEKEKNSLVQVQNDRFLFNWRMSNPTDEYPRYEELARRFREYLGRFCKFIDQNELGSIDVVGQELTYVNLIGTNDFWSDVHDIGCVFPTVQWNDRYDRLKSPRAIGFKAQFEIPDNCGVLATQIDSVKHGADQLLAWKLEMAASRSGNSTMQDANDWFDIAHTWIVSGFEEITSDELQENVWKKV